MWSQDNPRIIKKGPKIWPIWPPPSLKKKKKKSLATGLQFILCLIFVE